MRITILEWFPEYEEIKLLCEVGMTFLTGNFRDGIEKRPEECICESYANEEIAMIDIYYGNGISCTYTTNLLSDFQQKSLDIVVKM